MGQRLRNLFASIDRKTADEYEALRHDFHTQPSEQTHTDRKRYLDLRDSLPAAARKEIDQKAGCLCGCAEYCAGQYCNGRNHG